MDNFTVLSLWAMSGLIAVFGWRLYKALHTNSNLEGSYSEQQAALQAHQNQLQTLKSDHHLKTLALSKTVAELQAINQHQQENLDQITKDHEALQNRHRVLEQDLLAQMKNVSKSEMTLQDHRLAQANLTQKLKQQLSNLQEVVQENKRLQSTTNKLAEALKIAQAKMETFEQEVQHLTTKKNQIERELQRELQKNVVLEDQLKQFTPSELELATTTPEPFQLGDSKGPMLPTF